MNTNELVKLLHNKKLKIATAESCTGGLIAKKLTDVSGASEVFEMGLVSYSNRIKNEFLDVSNNILNTKGAVNKETARQMAIGITKLADSDIGIGITGFAGPTGDKVGLVYISVYLRELDKVIVKELILKGNREEIREQAADIAINEVLQLIL